MKYIDNFLNKFTMYRVVVYELLALLALGVVFGALHLVPYNPVFIVYSAVLIFGVCLAFNYLFAFLFDAATNPESTWITALILALLISPPVAFLDPHYLPLMLWASAWAIASKYILAISGKHIFNPAAFGVAVTGVALGLGASWWVGTWVFAPFTLLGGLLIVRKIHRFDLWWAFMAVTVGGAVLYATASVSGVLSALGHSLIYAPVFFLSTVMLTEPATTPPTRAMRMLYGAIVALFFLPSFHVGSFYFSPELALLAGNIFVYVVSPDVKMSFILKEKRRLTRDVWEFIFFPARRFRFSPGQYLEWTLPHQKADSRSVRRYFTIASAPERKDVRLGIKFYEPSSSFKRALSTLEPGDTIHAGQLAGDFTLPRNKERKLVFVAGGIGITPFVSMLEHLLAKREARPITLFYCNKTPDDAAYAALLERVEQELGVRVVHVFSDSPAPGKGQHLDADLLMHHVPDWRARTFYISGPQGLVQGFKKTLQGVGVKRHHIRTDYFPGFA